MFMKIKFLNFYLTLTNFRPDKISFSVLCIKIAENKSDILANFIFKMVY